MRILVFFLLCYGPRASRLGHKRTGKNWVCNSQYGPRTQLVRGIYPSKVLYLFCPQLRQWNPYWAETHVLFASFSGLWSYSAKISRKVSRAGNVASFADALWAGHAIAWRWIHKLLQDHVIISQLYRKEKRHSWIHITHFCLCGSKTDKSDR